MWEWDVGNGWCQYVALADVPAVLGLALEYSISDTSTGTRTACGAVTAPAACTTALTVPSIIPFGGAYCGLVKVTIGTNSAGASTYYALSGAQQKEGPILYTGPFYLYTPGSTVVSAYSSMPGAITSVTVSNSYTLSFSADSRVKSLGSQSLVADASGGMAESRLLVPRCDA